MANSGQSTYFKVPYGWHKISDASLSSELKAETGSSGAAWTVAYEAGGKPTAGDFLSFGTGQPFVFAEVGQLSSTASSELSYDTLRDFFLPVTSTARQNATAQGFPLTGFNQIRDQVLTPGQGVHGVRETFEYTYTKASPTPSMRSRSPTPIRPSFTSSCCTAQPAVTATTRPRSTT